jgi:hypothetical protein
MALADSENLRQHHDVNQPRKLPAT